MTHRCFSFLGGGGWWDTDSNHPKVPVLPPFSCLSLVWSTLKDLKVHHENTESGVLRTRGSSSITVTSVHTPEILPEEIVDLQQDQAAFWSLVLQLREMCTYVPGTIAPLV